ncbi:hypothetical protein [Rivularia sp. UHCC 0363]|uniref:hypothetical protein n=1 Tax=Rivularia sp. UHCC 0363 TaxID=3110244 RepID=UPI002B1F4E73|nr:hypothetical protein [Rivularia sp. UHCC 0363]MEA5597223.1 hypothetical protein [Rivularia sp. UHCC 0363]
MAVFTEPASAREIDSTRSKFSCGRQSTVALATPSLGCTRLNRQKSLSPNELPELEFTDEESDAAIALFGCDCPSCLNAMRQMRGLPPMGVN